MRGWRRWGLGCAAPCLLALGLAGCGGAAPQGGPGALRVARGQSVSSVLSIGQPVDVEGTVRADVHVLGADVTLGSQAEVGGNVAVIGGALRLRPGARVEGLTFDLDLSRLHLNEVLAASSLWAAWVLLRLLGTAALLGLALASAAIVPRWVTVVGERLRASPWGAARVGLWSAVLTLLVAVALVLTVIGLPVAAGVGALAAVASVVGFAGLGYTLGDVAAARLDADWPGGVRKVALGLGAVLSLSFVPFVGPLLLAVSLLIGFGAVVTAVHAWVRRS